MKFSAVIVTRGGTDLKPCLETIFADEYLIYRGEGRVWDRYLAALDAKHDLIYTQDDDCRVDSREILAQHIPGFVTCNMPLSRRLDYPDGIGLMGWGSVFEKSKIRIAFNRYLEQFPPDALFHRECDRVFTGLNPLQMIDVPFRHLPWAFDKDRLSACPEHGEALREIRRRIKVVRGDS